jgi:hypothetical protein
MLILYQMKRLLAITGLLITIVLHGQETLKHEKKAYISPDGLIYVNKSLPIYLRMALSPEDDAKTYLLKSKKTPKYANPMYLDTEGFNSIRSPSAVDTVTKKAVYPNQDILFEVYADSKAPVSRIDFGSSKTYEKENKLYVNGMINITLKAIDLTSGIENIYCSLDGDPFVIYTNPIKLDQEKEYTIKYYAVDNVGNTEKWHELIIIIDKTNPTTSYEISGDYFEKCISARSGIILKSSDASGTGVDYIVCKIDGGEVKKYISPILGAYLAPGEHKITYYATDKVGNTEHENLFEFYVDKTPPVIIQEIIGKSFFASGKKYTSGHSQLKLTTLDNMAGIKEVFYLLNGGEYKKYDQPVSLSKVTGNLTIKAKAFDNVNNETESIESGDKTIIPCVDMTGPVVKHGFSGPVFVFRDTAYVSSKTKIYFKATDNESGLARIEYTIDNDSAKAYQHEFSVGKQGIRNIYVTGYDNVENTSSTHFVLKVDTTGPEIYFRFSINPTGSKISADKVIEEYPRHIVLFLSSTDNMVGFDQMFYSFNGSQERKYEGLINYFPTQGDYNVKVRAEDKLGNETLKQIAFFIDDK